MTNHTADDIRQGIVPEASGFLPSNAMRIDGNDAGAGFVDNGFSNIAVRPTADDLGWGGNSPFINPLTNEPFPLAFAKLAILKRDNLLPPEVAQFVPDLPGEVAGDRVIVDGTFKVSGLRNVELTGPYFHNGGQATLAQVLEFYDRKGDFSDVNIAELDGAMALVQLEAEDEEALIAFLVALTDERVRYAMAPFDHPQLFVTNGHPGNNVGITAFDTIDGVDQAEDSWLDIPAVGAGGRVAPLQPFLGLDPFIP